MDIKLVLSPIDSEMFTTTGKRKRCHEQAEDEYVEAQETKRPRKRDNVLCELCGMVDFNAIFNPTSRQRQKLCNLKQMTQNTRCKLCGLIIATLREEIRQYASESDTDIALRNVIRGILSGEDGQNSSDAACTICFRHTPDLYLRRSNVAPFYHAGVSFKPTGHKGRGKDFILLDRVGSVDLNERSLGAYAMMRKPLSATPFDAAKLHERLTSSDKAMQRKSLPRAVNLVDRGLKSLMDIGRFRVIDVNSGAVIVPNMDVRYVALSYVWGGKMADYSASYADLSYESIGKCGYVDLQKTPRTVRDAAALLMAIHERYLWVDAYCIDQSDADDKHANIFCMSAVYENAYFTIIAAAGDDADAGLTRYSDNSGMDEKPTAVQARGGDILLLPARKGIIKTLGGTKWASRAWTFQERSLSRRCVIFTRDEVLFHSSEFEAREAYQLVPITSSFIRSESRKKKVSSRRGQDFNDRLSAHKRMAARQYIDAVQQYSRRELTYPGDRLDAFSGILEKYYSSDSNLPDDSQTHIQALSGMPWQRFKDSLAWDFICPASTLQKPIRITHDTRRSRYFPSWSWIGWRGGITFPENLWGGVRDIVDTVNITLNLAGTTWKEGPLLCQVERPLRITLHVWARSVPCRLEPVQLLSGELDFLLWITDSDAMSELDMGTVLENNIRMPDPDTALQHYFISLHTFRGPPYLLIEGTGISFTRLGLLNRPFSRLGGVETQDRYFQLR